MNCNNCVYANYPKIPPSKRFKADVVVVGEAPGTTEIARRVPFIGPSGQLLDKAMEAAQFPARDKIFVTNALLCRPPQNKPQIRQAIDNCRDRVLAEIAEVEPKLIIALGNIAMHSITGDYNLKITAEQGRIMKSQYIPKGIIVPALHPAAILRAPGDYKMFYSAMIYAGGLLRGNEPLDPGETQWQEVETEEQLQVMISFLRNNAQKVNIVAADIETTGLDSRRDRILVIGVAFAKNKVFVVSPEMIQRALFEIPQLRWCWQGGKFDTAFLRRSGMPATVHHDTMLLSYCLNENSGVHGLEALASRLLGAQPYKHKVRKKVGKKGFGALPKYDLYERVAVDADYTRQILFKLLPQVERNPLLKKLYYELLIPASAFLRRVQRNGIFVNRALLQEFKIEYQAHLDEVQGDIIDIAMKFWNPRQYMADTQKKSAPEIFNPGSTYQVGWLLFEKLRLRRPRGKKSNSTDKEVLEKLSGQHPIIDKMLEYRSVAKELSTYIIGVEKRIGGDNRVHSTFNLHITTTGRLSSKEPNVQNVPARKPRVRTIYQAPKGMWLIEGDYKGAELRVLAELSRDEFLMNCFLQGRDLHTEVAEADGIPRIAAKTVNFGIAYGRTEYSIAEELEISIEEARRYIQGWFDRAPQAKAFLDDCARAPIEGRVLTTPFGRHRRFGLVTPENLQDIQNEARNFRIQSIASDFTLISAMRAEKPLNEMGVKIINLVHDSILVELPQNESVALRAMKLLDDTMKQVPIDTMNAVVPFEVEFKRGTVWGMLEEVK